MHIDTYVCDHVCVYIYRTGKSFIYLVACTFISSNYLQVTKTPKAR